MDEENDPYKGTEFEGLDAYQRQLKRFDLVPSKNTNPKQKEEDVV